MIGTLVRLSQYINTYAAEHWESFATQNYFDRGGIFIGIMFCGPLLFYCMMMLFMFLREASQLLIQVKTYEIKKKRTKEAKAKKNEDDNGRRGKKSNKKTDWILALTLIHVLLVLLLLLLFKPYRVKLCISLWKDCY